MEDWKEYKLGEVGKITTGKTPKTAIKDYYGGNIDFVTPADINTPYKYISKTERHLTEMGLDSIVSNSIDEGSICVSCIGNIGYAGIVKLRCASNQQINSITVSEYFDRDFIYYSIKNLWSFFKNYEGQSTTVSILNKGHFANISIKCPSLDTQKKIASILSSLDDKIECNRKINENLEAQAQALFKSWFVDFEPFRNGPFIDSELGPIPQGWRVATLGQVTTSLNNKVKDRTDVKVLSPVTTGELVLSEDYFTKQVFSESIAKYIIVHPGEFAYNPARVNIGSIGMNTFDFDGCVSPVYVVFKCEDNYCYFFDIFKSTTLFKEEVKMRAIGGVRQTLGYKDFSMVKVVYPPIDVIVKFNQIYIKMIKVKSKNDKENCRLAELRDALLPKLMSGELKLSDVEL